MVKLSFILPCYNVERYIADCLDSIYAQDMSEDEYEVICVDDCSTDNTCMVIEEWVNLHSNLTLIRNPRNMRVGIARNVGIKNANGEFVCFVDADDMLPKSVMTNICSVAINDNLDVLLYNNIVVDNREYREGTVMFRDSDVRSGGDYLEEYLKGNIGYVGAPWAKLFNRLFLLQHSIWYSDLVYSEDAAFVWEVMICANRVKSISDVGYIYRGNETSFSANKKKPFVLYTCSILYPNVLKGILDKCGEGTPEVIRKGVDNEIETVVNCFFCDYLSFEKDKRREVYSMIRNNTSYVWKLKEYIHRRQKIAFLSQKLGYSFFDAIVKKLFARRNGIPALLK